MSSGTPHLPEAVHQHIAGQLPSSTVRASSRAWCDAHDAACEVLQLRSRKAVKDLHRMVTRMPRLRAVTTCAHGVYRPMRLGPIARALTPAASLRELEVWAEDDVHKLAALTQLTRLVLHNYSEIGWEVPLFEWLPQLKNLKALELHDTGNELDESELEALETGLLAMTQLTRLLLSETNITDRLTPDETSSLTALSNLQVLELTTNCLPELPASLTALKLQGAEDTLVQLGGLTNLQSLDITKCEEIRDLASVALTALTNLTHFAARTVTAGEAAQLPQLRSLILDQPNEDHTDITALTRLTGLTKLQLEYIRTATLYTQMHSFSSLTALRDLHLGALGSDPQPVDMSWVSALSGLTCLTVSGVQSITGAEAWTALRQLRVLHVNKCGVHPPTSALATSLEPWAGLVQGLEELCINCSWFDSWGGLRDISPLAGAGPRLKRLQLPGSTVTSLAPLAGLQLTELTLDRPQWSEAMVNTLAQLTSLQHLQIQIAFLPPPASGGQEPADKDAGGAGGGSGTVLQIGAALACLTSLSSLRFTINSNVCSVAADSLLELTRLTRLESLFVQGVWDQHTRKHADMLLSALPRLPVPRELDAGEDEGSDDDMGSGGEVESQGPSDREGDDSDV